MERGEDRSRPGPRDPVLPAEVVTELTAPHLPDGVRLTGMTVDESGSAARVYLLDRSDAGGVAVKVQRPHRRRPGTSLAKEAALLDALAGPLAGRIPAVHGSGRVVTAAGPVEFVVLSRVPGRAVGARWLPAIARRELLRAVADVLRGVHALDADDVRFEGTLPTVVGAAGLRAELERDLADLVERLAEEPHRWPLEVPAGRVAELALAALPREPAQPPVPLHGNPGPADVLTGPDGAFTGLIDLADAHLGHPALDLRSWPDVEDRQLLREAYLDGQAPGAEWEAVWTTAMVAADMAALAGGTPRPIRVAGALVQRLGQL